MKVDRVEWLVVPDHATAAAALSSGEVDWWENPPADLVPVLAANAAVVVRRCDPLGGLGCLRFNHLYPPFDNAEDASGGADGDDPGRFHDRGRRRPEKLEDLPFVLCLRHADGEQRRLAALTGKRDFEAAKKLIAEAGYKGEKSLCSMGSTSR